MDIQRKQPISEDKKAEPQKTSGIIPVAGKSVPIDPTSIDSLEGGTADEVVKSLEKLSKKRIFSEPPNEEND